MEFPIEMQMLINDYARPCTPGSEVARPMTRPDWRKGSYVIRILRAQVPAGFHRWEPEHNTLAYLNPDTRREHLKMLVNEFGGNM